MSRSNQPHLFLKAFKWPFGVEARKRSIVRDRLKEIEYWKKLKEERAKDPVYQAAWQATLAKVAKERQEWHERVDAERKAQGKTPIDWDAPIYDDERGPGGDAEYEEAYGKDDDGPGSDSEFDTVYGKEDDDDEASSRPQGAVQTGPRGGKYIEMGDSKQYVGKALYLNSTHQPTLYMDVVEPPELILKAKYIKREGSPGSYKYTYAEGSGGKSKKEPKLNKTAQKMLSQKHGTHYGNFNSTQFKTFNKLEAAGLMEMKNSSAVATEKGKAALTAHKLAVAEKDRAATHGSVSSPTTESGHSIPSVGGTIQEQREKYRSHMKQNMTLDQHRAAGSEFEKMAKDPKLSADQKTAASAAGQVHASEYGRMAHEARYNKSFLYLDLKKGNNSRDPLDGKYFYNGTTHKAAQTDLSDKVADLLGQLPGEEMKKDE